MMRVDVSHPGGNALARHLVAAALAAGHNTKFLTGVYARDPEGGAFVRLLPAGLRQRVIRELKRRTHAGIPGESVRSFPMIELPNLVAARLGISDRVGREMRRHRDNWFDRRVTRVLRREPPDVFIGHDGSCLHSLQAAKACGTVAVLNQVVGFIKAWGKTVDEVACERPGLAEELLLPPHEERIARCTQEVLEAEYILVPSAYVRDTLLAEGVAPERMFVLPYGVDVTHFTAPTRSRDDGRLRLLFVGQIGLRKGIPYLLDAVQRLNRSDIDLTLVGPIPGSIDSFRRHSPLFRHIPQVPHHEVHRIFQEADVFVFPSLHEGSAFVLYEALASGLPVVTTHNSGSVVRDGVEGFIVPARDSAVLADRIQQLAEDPELRRQMGLKARLRAEEHTWDHYRAGLSKFLETCSERSATQA